MLQWSVKRVVYGYSVLIEVVIQRKKMGERGPVLGNLMTDALKVERRSLILEKLL